MTRKGWLLLALVLAGPGCISPLTHLDEDAKKTTVAPPPPPPPPIVSPEDVTESNAIEKAKALSAELDYAQNERPQAPATPARENAKKP